MIRLLVLLGLFGIELTGHRISNHSDKCTLACIETAGRANGVKKLEGFYGRTRGPGQCSRMEAALKKEGVNYYLEKDWVYNRETLTKYAEVHGVVVTILAGANWIDFRGEHSILVTKYGDDVVEFYDPNRSLELRTVSRAEFDRFWSGNAIVILPDAK